jgi:hypothetical protein
MTVSIPKAIREVMGERAFVMRNHGQSARC